MSTLNTAGTGLWTSYELFDGFLRPRQTQALAPTGTGRVITDTYHDTRGLVTKTNAGYYTTGAPGTSLVVTSDLAAPSQTRVSFDGAGRETGSALFSYAIERWHTSTAYGGDRVDDTAPSGGTATSTMTDARGRKVGLRQYHGATPTPATPGSYDATSYGYDHAGRLTSVVDHAGVAWSWTYDQRGRRTVAIDPDKGTTLLSYDDADRLTSTTDARGVTLSYVYDELDRRTQTWQGAPGSGTKRAQWTYDSILLGHPTSATRLDAGNAYVTAVTGYDAGYRPTGAAVTIPAVENGLAGTYGFTASYTANGSISTRTLPAAGGLAAETLTTTYHANGAPRKLTGTSDYVTQTTYLQTGPVSSMTHDTITAYRSFDYDPVTLRLSHLNVQAASTPDILKETDYGYDDAGNITKITDLLEQYGPAYGPDDTQCFSYDHLRRLTQAWTPDAPDCASAPSVPGLGGAAPYWLSWTFDPTGNRTSQTSHTAGGDQTTTYSYPLPTQPRPHTLTATSGAQSASYSYDDAGKTTGRPGASGQQTLTWDPEGHLATVAEGEATSSYLYDATGTRLITRDPTGTTLHLPMGTEITVNPSGAAAATRTYRHAGQVVATRTSAEGLSWLFTDHLGTATISVRHAGMAVTRRYQTPYGTPRGTPPPTWPNQHGYVNGYRDTTGLTHLGAREYDPSTGTFASPDPILNIADPQQMNGYSYATNSPVTYSDPTGLLAESGCPVCPRVPWINDLGRSLARGLGVLAGFGEVARRSIAAGLRQVSRAVVTAVARISRVVRAVANALVVGVERAAKTVRDVIGPAVAETRHRAGTAGLYLWDSARRRATNPVQTLRDGALNPMEAGVALQEILFRGADLKRDGDYCGREAECLVNAAPPAGVDAMTSGHTIRFREALPDESLVAHEIQHVYDIENYGWVNFYLTYGLDYLHGLGRGMGHRQAYENIYWERRAFDVTRGYSQGVRPRGWRPW